jgi:cyclopropane fatty-acyl-phospholipid synthase-like methyltransferase
LLLDHGCGSGNHLEFFTRIGVRAIGTEVAPAALRGVRERFAGAMLPQPELLLFDPQLSLGPQLPSYNHVIAWGSTHYNQRAKVLADINALIDALPPGGVMIFQIPSTKDVAARQSRRLPDGSFEIVGGISSQTGAICTFAEDENEVVAWLQGLDLIDLGRLSTRLLGNDVDYFFAYGTKAHATLGANG